MAYVLKPPQGSKFEKITQEGIFREILEYIIHKLLEKNYDRNFSIIESRNATIDEYMFPGAPELLHIMDAERSDYSSSRNTTIGAVSSGDDDGEFEYFESSVTGDGNVDHLYIEDHKEDDQVSMENNAISSDDVESSDTKDEYEDEVNTNIEDEGDEVETEYLSHSHSQSLHAYP